MSTYELQKNNIECSNIFFIDENFCAGNSLEIINNNFLALSGNLINLSRDLDTWNTINNLFWQTSAKMIETTLNIENIYNTVNLAFSTVETLSSNWNKQFSLYYPQIQPIDTWMGYNKATISSILIGWLDLNFPSDHYVDDQIVNIFVTLNQDVPFSFNFFRTYEEACSPFGGTISISCEGCNSGNQGSYRNKGCNHHGGAAGYGACDNAYTHCGSPDTKTKDSASYTCVPQQGARLTGGPGGPLVVGLTTAYSTLGTNAPINNTDKTIARVLSYKFYKSYNYIEGAKWNMVLI
jgi:hypothetical protein